MPVRGTPLYFAATLGVIGACNCGSPEPGITPGDANALAETDTDGGTHPDTDAGTEPDADDAGNDDAALAACPPPASESCIDPASAPSYAQTIAPILDRSCSTCHDPNAPSGPWPLTRYLDVQAWAALIADDLARCTMPPPDGGTKLTEGDRQLIFAWLTCGSPDN